MQKAILKYVLKACIRDRLILSLLVATVVAVSLSVFIGSSSVTEQDQFVMVFIASSLRYLYVIGITLFIAFYCIRMKDTRELDFLLTRPVTRVQYVISHGAVFLVLALFFSAIVTGLLSGIFYKKFEVSFLIWGFSFFGELLIVTYLAYFFSMVLKSVVTAALSTLAFYTFSKIIGQILGIVHDPLTGGDRPFLSGMMEAISLVVPRLDLFTQNEWLLYGTGEGATQIFLILFVQTALFGSVLIAATCIDLLRRDF